MLVQFRLILVVDIGLSLWLKETSLRVAGLAVANTVAFGCGVVVLLVIIRRRIPSFEWREIARGVSQGIVGSIPLAAMCLGYTALWRGRWEVGSSAGLALRLGAVCVLGGAAAIGIYLLLRVDVLRDLMRRRHESD